MNGTSYGAKDYLFPSRTETTSTDTRHEVTLETPATGMLTFTPQGAQAAWIITLTGTKASYTGISFIQNDAKAGKGNIYDLAGRVVKKNASAQDMNGLNKGIYIFQNKKYIVK